MTTIADRYIEAEDISIAWLQAIRILYGINGQKAVHLVVRVANPVSERQEIRNAAQQLIDEWNATHTRNQMEHIETTRNTIFPAAFARRTNGPEELAAYYRARLNRNGLMGFRQNERGTYFGRIVAYPRADGEAADQLSETTRKLRQELSAKTSKSSRYEISIYNERLDRSPMSFPCLAHVSLHLHDRQLHLQAIYRNEFLIGRAYGNFLGLAEFQRYLADAVQVAVGELMITAGHVQLDGSKTAIADVLRQLRTRQ